ncbi:TatD DNase family protein [Gracilibacillus kekensis]|uniref:TatD DNase family protein n=2 Tax=Gracilibacillus kekensis TaxID=1027249 RepID=A0A1M7IC63_9BACI|nr:TatD family hydrolase [Gracilibacillus kekensis]SHM38406.1 TatD DNase family protein [Gracilibacillus kekensis]
MIDAHIHLDWYKREEQLQILDDLRQNNFSGLIAVSSDLESCRKVWDLSSRNEHVHPAFGWHPEQSIPGKAELDEIEALIRRHHHDLVAIGEIGLPYYKRKKDAHFNLQPYLEILERFILLAKELDLPVVLHAIYEDAELVCDLLEKHHIKIAHFHWFKGSASTLQRMMKNKYKISITPDCLYENEIQEIIRQYPLELLMVETDGPWQFEGPFRGKMTHPVMIKQSIKMISEIKGKPLNCVKNLIVNTTKSFYNIRGKRLIK